MRLLLWKIGALGDVLMTTPLVRQLRRALPDARIDYLVGSSARFALEGNPHLDSVIPFDDAILYRRQAGRLPEMLDKLTGYDAIYTLDKHWIFHLLARFSGSRERIGFRRRAIGASGLTRQVPYGALRHEIDYYLDLAQAAGVSIARDDVRIEFTAETPFAIDPRTTVLVNSGGANAYETSQVRRMPGRLFEDLVEACRAHGPVAFLGSAGEAEYYDRFERPGCTNLCGCTTIPEAASVLRLAARVIATDTGLMHLAAAVNRNVTCVFGPTHPYRKCPPGARWVWADAQRYDSSYELFGRVPGGPFFEGLRVQDIMSGSQPSPWDRA
jgi:ADP-heptose:LPS heptosyltransferase